MSLLLLSGCLILFTNICCLSEIKIESKCSIIDTCTTCIREIGCAWCISADAIHLPDFRPCFNEDQIKNYTHACAEIISPQLNFQIIKNDALSTGKNAVQIKPQKVRINLRRGQEYKLEFKYAQAADYPVDLYYVMDLSGSMKQFRNQLSALGVQLSDTMKSLTKNFRIGFGSFVDKSIYPFAKYTLSTPCTGPNCDYVFKNHLSLTDRADIFSQEVAKSALFDGGDDFEDGLDALLQAIVCTEQIGWRKKARHLLVFTTDEGFHLAGDGKSAGIVIPHDGKCHLTNNYYTHGLLLDFPSIGLINAKAIEHGVNIIFAITSNIVKEYIPLQKQIKNSFIQILRPDSSNVIDLIKEFYGKIVDSVQISDNSKENIEIKYYSKCSDGVYQQTNQCDNLTVGVQINFTAVIKLVDCSEDGQKTIFIKPSGLNEALQVDINMVCDCDCEKAGNKYFKANATECLHQGNLKCGICDCFPNKLGTNCECDKNELNLVEDSECRPDNTTEYCSGLGVCKCNKCDCQKRNNAKEINYGKYCQCNNYSCKRHNGEVCSGETRGICDCGKCRCLSGYTGDACECLESNIGCISPENNKICSGNGVCHCGKCECHNGHKYSGQYCDECNFCKGSQCAKLQHCVECSVYGTGFYKKDECIKQCKKYKIEKIDDVDENNLEPFEKFCIFVDENDCYFKFKYTYTDDKSIIIYAQTTKVCSEFDVLALVFIIIGSILLGGLIMLIIWKTLTFFHDRKEFAKFEEERQKAGWMGNDNPLFKSATTNFTNPTFREDL